MPQPRDLPERLAPDDPREWLNRAWGNLRRARLVSPGIYLEDLCFDAQQAAEKAFKALLLSRSLPFPFTHDLSRLLSEVDVNGIEVPEEILDAARLTRYAVSTRYPGTTEEVTSEDHLSAVRIAEAVVTWVEGYLDTPDEPLERTNSVEG
jgi:HEPN domain-containing protein